MTKFDSTVERWRPRVAAAAGSIPVNFLLAWMQRESDGKLSELSKLGERGLFQIHPDEISLLGISQATFESLTTDPDAAVASGIRAATVYGKYAKNLLHAFGVDGWVDTDYWKLVKLHHNAFSAPQILFGGFASTFASSPFSWWALNWFAHYAADNAVTTVQANIRALVKRAGIMENAEFAGSFLPQPELVVSTVLGPAIAGRLFIG